jgi:homoserine dehydrogenase
MTANYKDNNELTDEEVDQTCGILQAPKSVTLEQMDEAIKLRASTCQNQMSGYANANPTYND